MLSNSPEKLLITGAAGNIGRKLAKHFQASGKSLTLIDQRPADGLPIVCADLAEPGDWQGQFAGIDVAIHLAATISPEASAAECERTNVVATRNVIEAARRHGVRRIVFASTCWTMMGYGDGVTIREDMPPNPKAEYGRSKVQCEQDLAAFGPAICLRVGWVPEDGGREVVGGYPAAIRSLWLSDRDCCQAFARAVEVPLEGFEVCTVTSANWRSPWRIDRAKALLGYRPSDGVGPFERRRWRLRREWQRFTQRLAT